VSQPNGEDEDDNVWVFSRGSTSGTVTAEEAGTTLTNFTTTGFIFHQRKDHTIIKWPYDSNVGVIGKKIFVKESDLKRKLDQEKLEQGRPTERQELDLTR